MRAFILLLSCVIALSTGAAWGPAHAATGVDVGADGLHVQPWFHVSRGDLRSDLLTAAAAGKEMLVLWEQKGCTYCQKLHEVNFAKPEIRDVLQANFIVVQLDLRGAGGVIDLDGTQLSEAALAQRWGVTTTPTSIVLAAADPMVRTASQAELFRLPGYLEPFQYYGVLDYFASGAYESIGLKAHLGSLARDFAQQGVDPAKW